MKRHSNNKKNNSNKSEDILILVQEVAEKINLCPKILNRIMERLAREYIFNQRQLESITDDQWSRMNAPIGFVNALRTFLVERNTEEEDMLSSARSLRTPSTRNLKSLKERKFVHVVRSSHRRDRDSSPRKPKKPTSYKSDRPPRYTSIRLKNNSSESSLSTSSMSVSTVSRQSQSSTESPKQARGYSSSVRCNKETGRYCYSSKGKIVYEWEQSFDSIVLYIPKPDDINEDDIKCSISESSLRVGSKEKTKWFFNRPTGGSVISSKSIWCLYGGCDVKGIMVTLAKASPGNKWRRPLKPSFEDYSPRQKKTLFGSWLDFEHPTKNSAAARRRKRMIEPPSDAKASLPLSPSLTSLSSTSSSTSSTEGECNLPHQQYKCTSKTTERRYENKQRSCWDKNMTSIKSMDIEARSSLDDRSQIGDEEKLKTVLARNSKRQMRKAPKGKNCIFWTPQRTKRKEMVVGTSRSSGSSSDEKPTTIKIPSKYRQSFTEFSDNNSRCSSFGGIDEKSASYFNPDDYSECQSRRSSLGSFQSGVSKRGIPKVDNPAEAVGQEMFELVHRTSKSMDEFNMVMHHYTRDKDELMDSLRTFQTELYNSFDRPRD